MEGRNDRMTVMTTNATPTMIVVEGLPVELGVMIYAQDSGDGTWMVYLHTELPRSPANYTGHVTEMGSHRSSVKARVAMLTLAALVTHQPPF
jgi:hypothetical protein